jgi:AMMECR1 domain-containing protein
MSRQFPLSPLVSPLPETERSALHGSLRELLTWQRSLKNWPTPPSAPDATPIVSLYAHGGLCGCAGVSDGPPGERILRAFLQALGDSRFGGLGPKARAELRCQLSYARAVRPVLPSKVAELLEVGRHGLAIALPGGPVTLLPDVARDNSLDTEGMLQTLERKGETARAAWPEDGLFLFETESVLVRQTETPALERNPITAAAAWLATRVDSKGRVTFGISPRTAEQHRKSPMFHGRAAILVRALLSQRVGRGAATRARRWLEVELVRALAGRPVDQFPNDPALVAGTLALAVMSGIELSDALMAYSARPELLAVPWHAAQVVTALGSRAPDALWAACKRHLHVEPWAPWTALAAKARGDGETFARATEALIDAVPEHGPHVGGVGPNSVPELARTAATVEALLSVDSSAARAARARARAFLLEHQVNGNSCILAADPELVHGAFPQTPVHDYLQIDVTGHALLALVGSSHSVPPTEFVRPADSWVSG